ncbi:MAG: FixH family protein [Thermodesulfovibrionales bacterium]
MTALKETFYEFINKGLFLFLILIPLLACGREKTADRIDCDIDAGPCTKTIAAESPVQVTLEIGPRPLSAMKRLLFRVKAVEKDAAIKDAEVFIDLTMPGMSMMENRIQLRQAKDNSYVGEGVIVKCSSGGKVWRADITIGPPRDTAHGRMSTSFQFRVSR